MKHEFAKLFIVDDHQVLITKEYDTEDERYLLKVESQHEGCSFAARMGYNSLEDRDRHFEKQDQNHVEKIYNSMFKDMFLSVEPSNKED